MTRLADTIKPIIADANMYFCSGTDWDKCVGEVCMCKQQAKQTVLLLLLVLREPTGDMLKAGNANMIGMMATQDGGWQDALRAGWYGMVDAALKEEQDDQ